MGHGSIDLLQARFFMDLMAKVLKQTPFKMHWKRWNVASVWLKKINQK